MTDLLVTLADWPKSRSVGVHDRSKAVLGAPLPRVPNVNRHNLPSDAVYIGSPTKWANPFMTGRDGGRDEVITMYERWLHDDGRDLMATLAEVSGVDLVCCCRSDVLSHGR